MKIFHWKYYPISGDILIKSMCLVTEYKSIKIVPSTLCANKSIHMNKYNHNNLWSIAHFTQTQIFMYPSNTYIKYIKAFVSSSTYPCPVFMKLHPVNYAITTLAPIIHMVCTIISWCLLNRSARGCKCKNSTRLLINPDTAELNEFKSR